MKAYFTKQDKMIYLAKCGWKAIRQKHEPVYWKDPLHCLQEAIRTESAFTIQERRDESLKNGNKTR